MMKSNVMVANKDNKFCVGGVMEDLFETLYIIFPVLKRIKM